MIDIFKDPLWDIMDAFTAYPRKKENRIATYGLRDVIRRPHNLINIKNDSGDIVAQRLEVVTTPFAKEDVKLSIYDNILSVECGSENKTLNENEELVYGAISNQSYSFSLKLAPSIDQAAITAENVDGVLKVTLPTKKQEEKTSEPYYIKIN